MKKATLVIITSLFLVLIGGCKSKIQEGERLNVSIKKNQTIFEGIISGEAERISGMTIIYCKYSPLEIGPTSSIAVMCPNIVFEMHVMPKIGERIYFQKTIISSYDPTNPGSGNPRSAEVGILEVNVDTTQVKIVRIKS